MKKSISIFILFLFVLSSCMKQSAETSNTPSAYIGCDDSIQNQGETGIDCGGPCAPCQSTMTAFIEGASFAAVPGNVLGQIQSGNTLYFSGSASNESISFFYGQAFLPGTYTGVQALYSGPTGNYTTQNATLTFSEFNLVDSVVAGTFDFTAINFSSLDTVVVTNGHFANVKF